jgi:hypothetical protein
MRQEVSRRLTVLAKGRANSPGESWTTVLAKVGRQSWQKMDEDLAKPKYHLIVYAGLLHQYKKKNKSD